MSLREQILQADDLKREPVAVPEWGVTVYVRMLTAGQRDEIESAITKLKDGSLIGVRARVLAACVCDESGALLFTAEDIPALSGKAAKPVERLFDVATRLNRITPADVEELRKNC